MPDIELVADRIGADDPDAAIVPDSDISGKSRFGLEFVGAKAIAVELEDGTCLLDDPGVALWADVDALGTTGNLSPVLPVALVYLVGTVGNRVRAEGPLPVVVPVSANVDRSACNLPKRRLKRCDGSVSGVTPVWWTSPYLGERRMFTCRSPIPRIRLSFAVRWWNS